MSYSLQIYSVKLDELRAAIGSGEVALSQKVIAENREEIESIDEWFADEIEEDECPPAAQAVEELICGTPSPSAEAAPQYLYALELICRSLGERVAHDVDIEEFASTNEDHLLRRCPISIDELPDFPGIGYLEADECESELARASTDPECSAELERILSRAVERKSGLIFFYY